MPTAWRGHASGSRSFWNHAHTKLWAWHPAFSVSQSIVEKVREYIARQAEHHARQSFQDEFRIWLKRYEVEWDERYVWD